jgi:hypothetical protein
MQGEDAGEGCAPARAWDLQPSGASVRKDLGAPVAENLDGLDACEREQAQRARESIDRRMADQELVRMLAEDGFEGRRYEAFVEDLARYALSVLRGWMYSGYVFKLVAQRGFGLHPTDAELDELRVDSELRQDLADMTVVRALVRFRQRALLEGGWAFEGGASITTYFMDACAYDFPNEFRKHRTSRARMRRAVRNEIRTYDGSALPSVESTVLGNARVQEHLAHPRDAKTQAVVALTLIGYSQFEISEMLDGIGTRAIEGIMYRWRQKAKAKEKNDGRAHH